MLDFTQSTIDVDISVENTPVHSPTVLGWLAKEVKVPDTCSLRTQTYFRLSLHSAEK